MESLSCLSWLGFMDRSNSWPIFRRWECFVALKNKICFSSHFGQCAGVLSYQSHSLESFYQKFSWHINTLRKCMLTLTVSNCNGKILASFFRSFKHFAMHIYPILFIALRVLKTKHIRILLSISLSTNRICGQKKSENFCGGLIPLFLTLGIIFGMPWHYYRRYRRKKDISLKAMFQPDTEEDPERKRLGGKQIEGYKADRFRY